MDLTAFFKIIILTPPAPPPLVCVIETMLILELAVAGLGRQYSSLARSIYLISNRGEKRSEGDTVVEFRLDVRVANNIGYTGKEQDESTVYMDVSRFNPAETSYFKFECRRVRWKSRSVHQL